MAYTPIYSRKNFVNGSEPALSDKNLNEIEDTLVSIESSLKNATINPLLTSGTCIGFVTDYNGESKDIFIPETGSSSSSNSFGVSLSHTDGVLLGNFIINGVQLPFYSGSSMIVLADDIELPAGETLNIHTSSYNDLSISYFIDKPNLIPTVYSYNDDTDIFSIGGFEDDVVIRIIGTQSNEVSHG